MAVLGRRLIKKIIAAGLFFCFVSGISVSALERRNGSVENSEEDTLVLGLEAYRNQEWPSAAMMLRDAVLSGRGDSESVWYMMIMSQIYAGYYDSVINDCESFENLFPDSSMKPGLVYQKGRVMHLLGKNEEASTVLADFCINYPDNPMYVSALFWLAECFYDECDYASAQSIYSLVVAKYPDDEKYSDSVARLDELGRSERERKLLYLLKVTGEEYLSLKEKYESLLGVRGLDFDSEDLSVIQELVDYALKNGSGIDQSKLFRLNEKLEQFKN